METILIVDDEKNYLVVLSAFLSEEGYETVTAENGKEALEIVESTDLDLVLTHLVRSKPHRDGHARNRVLTDPHGRRKACRKNRRAQRMCPV